MKDTTSSLHFEIFAGYNQAKIPLNSHPTLQNHIVGTCKIKLML